MTRLRADLQLVPLYAPTPLPDVTLDLRDNTNLWGAPPAAVAALHALGSTDLREYPAVNGGRLQSALAERLGIDPACVVTGCGSDDVIAAAIRAAAPAGAVLAHATPSFSMVPAFARLAGLTPVGVPLTPAGAMDVDGLLATGAPVIYACSPNNPTGTVTSPEALRRLFERAPGIVILDAAYAEFTDAFDFRREAAGWEHVLVTRTFSKAWGLAGLRVGYGVGGRALVEAVSKARGPYTLSVAGERAAVAALEADEAWMQTAAAEARAVRDRAAALLHGRAGVRVWPSEGNFLFLETADSATALAARFRARGIGVRAFPAQPGIGDAIRFGVAPWPLMQRAMDVALELWP